MMSSSMMTPSVLSMWQSLPERLGIDMAARITAALNARESSAPCIVFFRADDIAVPGKQLARLMALFTTHRSPLCLAVVPAWLTHKRWHHLKTLGKKDPSLWCWHQHGWRHANHEQGGRKQEFGPGRSSIQIRADLCHGQERLQSIIGESFFPVFTPPWNRCSIETLGQLKSNGFRAVSRSRGQLPVAPLDLPDLSVNIDLHTRKEPGPASAWASLFKDMEMAASRNYCGFMIHHRLMNDAAFDFLDALLGVLKTEKGIRICGFADLVDIRAVDPKT